MERSSSNSLQEKYQSFREWQQRPYQVAPLSEEAHDCPTCGTHFEGNYCPRCGQSAKIGRYSFKKAFLLFLDVWGLGNRGMFRTLRDLILRPGYMIRDYLSGMQMAYFPPFKMFFLLITLSLLVDTGLNIKGINRIKQQKEQFVMGLEKADAERQDETTTTDSVSLAKLSAEEKAKLEKTQELANGISYSTTSLAKKMFEWIFQHFALFMLVGLLLVSGPLYWMFRHCPAIPDLSYSEFFVAMIFVTNMQNIYSILTSFLCLSTKVEFLIYLLSIIPIRQLSGYSYWQTILRVIVALILFAVIGSVLLILGAIVSGIIYVSLNG